MGGTAAGGGVVQREETVPTELVEIEIIKAVCGKQPGRILQVPGGVASMWIHQGKARAHCMVPPTEVSIKPADSRRKRTTTA